MAPQPVGASPSQKQRLPRGARGVAGKAASSDILNALLLILLYMIQGVPLGLSMGSMPYVNKEGTPSFAHGDTWGRLGRLPR